MSSRTALQVHTLTSILDGDFIYYYLLYTKTLTFQESVLQRVAEADRPMENGEVKDTKKSSTSWINPFGGLGRGSSGTEQRR
jgi:hypothetical protein